MQKTIVCVTDQLNCERIIKSSKLLAHISNTSLDVISIVNPLKEQFNPQAIEYLFEVSKKNGATMSVIYHDDFKKAIHNFIKNNKPINVITGIPSGENSVLYKLWNKFNNINFFIVDNDGMLQEVTYKIKQQLNGRML
ncbi:MAG: hypothetical protein RSB96_01800 [Oscillospiraceae bacterium]